MKIYLIINIIMLAFAAVMTGKDLKNAEERLGNRVTWIWAGIGLLILLLGWNKIPLLI